MAGIREEAQSFIDLGSWVVYYTDKVNSTAGASPEHGIAPYPGYRPPRTSAAVNVTTSDINSIIANATPSTPAHDLMRIISDVSQQRANICLAEGEMVEDQEHVKAPTRSTRIKIQGPARPVSNSKQVSADEREDEPMAGPSTPIGEPKSAEEDHEKAARLQEYRAASYGMYIRDDTPEGYSKA